jgi:hypothetical protein
MAQDVSYQHWYQCDSKNIQSSFNILFIVHKYLIIT